MAGDEVCTELLRIRQRLALTQRELAVIMGCNKDTVWRFERGIHEPPRYYVYGLKWLEDNRDNLLAACELEPEDVLNFNKPPKCKKCFR